MPKPNENEIIDSFGGKTHLERAQTRHLIRMIHLHNALASLTEPTNTFVLTTSDGRCLTTMPDKTQALDVGDAPTLWPESKAVTVASRWNRDTPSKDQVVAVYWRDHYKEQIKRLTVRYDAVHAVS